MRLIDAEELAHDLEYDVELCARALDDMNMVGKAREDMQWQKDCKQNCIWYISEQPTVDAVSKEELLKLLDAVTDIWFWENIGTVCNSKPLEECAGCKYEGHPFGKCLLKYLEERKKE